MAKKDPNYLDHLRHSCAHLLAAAVLELWPKAKPTIGPAIENGFYYDFDFSLYSKQVSDEDFPKIEEKMHDLVQHWQNFQAHKARPFEAKEQFADNQYKLELVDEITEKGESITFYKSGNFTDLCRGGHINNPRKELKCFKLLSVAGAYWRGSEKNPMLTRIYGTSWPTKQELDDYLQQLEEAKKRDHRKLGKELDLFTFSDLVGKGLPLFTPKGTILREELNKFSEELRFKQGFQLVWTPHITKNDLYKTSGHWDKFGDELFLVKSQETDDELVMKPMNCPHHQQIFASRIRSYKDLPIKYMETTTVYRDEKAGELIGLSRVRSVTQDDSHTFCTPDQIKDVYKMLIKVVQEFYNTLDMKLRARLSFRDPKQPEKYLGDPKLWIEAQSLILEVAKENNLDYFVAEGEAAFYGPKIDFMAIDAIGREWQVATPQLDFVQPQRFGLKYVDEKGAEQTPVMIHFALMGSIERFLSVYIEHTAGAFPAWLAPIQVAVLPISDTNRDYCASITNKLKEKGLRAALDERSETLQAKIRDAQLSKIPYMLVVGSREEEAKTVSVRLRSRENVGSIKLEEFTARIQEKIADRGDLW